MSYLVSYLYRIVVLIISKKIDESKLRLNELLSANMEQEDIESRRCNIILYRVEESKQALVVDRNKEDASYCEQFLSALGYSGSGVNHEDVKKVFRFGKRNEESESPRPLMVQLTSWRAKNLVMASLYKIKSLNAQFRDITVGHDLTKKNNERNAKHLLQKLKDEVPRGTLYTKSGAFRGNES